MLPPPQRDEEANRSAEGGTAAPIVLIRRHPERIEQVAGGRLLLFLAFIAALFHTLFRKKKP